jgi:hypothetical protein
MNHENTGSGKYKRYDENPDFEQFHELLMGLMRLSSRHYLYIRGKRANLANFLNYF